MSSPSSSPNWSIDQLQDAWQLASQLHDGQKYGGSGPGQQVEYINHIGSVAFEVLHAAQHTPGFDTHLALNCAVLHDTIEDTPLQYDRVVALFGQSIADGVQALTKNETLGSKADQMHDSLARIRQQPHEVWAVKMADRICNLYAPPFYWKRKRKEQYQAEALLIHEQLHTGNAFLAQRLIEKIEAYGRFM